ncbi:hypothetical protein HZS_6656 [Henneguya salminicola]|nr:hypothetical protein HZS_6656 [Henneguya salminicola]
MSEQQENTINDPANERKNANKAFNTKSKESVIDRRPVSADQTKLQKVEIIEYSRQVSGANKLRLPKVIHHVEHINKMVEIMRKKHVTACETAALTIPAQSLTVQTGARSKERIKSDSCISSIYSIEKIKNIVTELLLTEEAFIYWFNFKIFKPTIFN